MSDKKSYMNRKNILNESFLEKLFTYMLKGRIKKVEKMFKNNPHLVKATKDVDKAIQKYKDTLKKQGDWKIK